MGIISTSKSIGNVTEIGCGGTLTVTLGLTASPDIQTNPTDIVLVLDRSGSMSGQPLADMKLGVATFIDILSESSGGAPGTIGSGSRIGIVSFSDTAVQNTGLITDVPALKQATAALSAMGATNHSAAFNQATAMLSTSTNNKVIVLFTDGETTAGPNAAPYAAAARAQGIGIYCIGLIGSGGLDTTALNNWASDPKVTHVAIAPDSAALEQIFANLAQNLTVPGAQDITIHEHINPDFVILGTPVPTKGSVALHNEAVLCWKIPSLGETATESATLSFQIRHVSFSGGEKHVNAEIEYTDNQGNTVSFPDPTVSFPDPTVHVTCGPTVPMDIDLFPVDITLEGCQDYVIYNAGDLPLEDSGRILNMAINLLSVCPGKRVALAAVLTEEDAEGMLLPRGMKTFTIPAHNMPGCSDVHVTCMRFVLPDDGTPFCQPRTLRAQFMAHYVDHDFTSCMLLEG